MNASLIFPRHLRLSCWKKLADIALIALFLSGLCGYSSPSHAGRLRFTLTTAVSCGGGGTNCGTVSQSATTCKRECTLTVQAYPFTSWRFDHWEGGATGTANPTNVRMTSATLVTAVFVNVVSPPPSLVNREVIGYFTQWGIYQRNYLVKDVVAAGAMRTLTVINYAFAGIANDLTCTSVDPYADWNKSFAANESVDGVSDTVGQPLKGNFNQLKKLKALYPQIRVLISIGGWGDSNRFSDAALPVNRQKFVQSCIDMFIKGNFAAGVSGPDVFDGIDIDWEYPGACGATCNSRPEDKLNFTALVAEFRTQLNAAAGPGRSFLLTAATPASKYYHDNIDLPGIAAYLDWLNLMTYDFHGSWEPNGPTNHHANLYINPLDPSAIQLSVDRTVTEYLNKTVSRSKIAVGLPFHGRGWTNVPDGGRYGLFQSASGLPLGTLEPGVNDYKLLKTMGYPEIFDGTANASWLYDGNVYWTFDSPRAVRKKMRYILDRGLKGVMFWELAGDDGTLIGAVADCLDALSTICK